MRTLTINLLATALLLLGASSASALGFQMEINPGSTVAPSDILVASDVIILDIYMDAGPGLQFISGAVIYDDNGTLVYDKPASLTPSYVLYAPGSGSTAATYLIPNVNPPQYWNGINLPGKRQVIAPEYLESALTTATATGLHVWVATLVFHVQNPGVVNIELTLDAPNTLVQTYDNDVGVGGTYTMTGSFTFGHAVPEPTTAILIGFGVVGLALAGRRKD